MKDNMKTIMENWRRTLRVNDDYEYIESVLGIKIPLHEGKYVISESLRKTIIQEQLLLENWFGKALNFVGDKVSGFKDEVFSKFGNMAKLFKTLWTVVTDPKQIDRFTKTIFQKNIKPIMKSIKGFADKLKALKMPKFSQQIQKIGDSISQLNSLDGWKKTVSLVGISLMWKYTEGAIGELIGKKIDQANPLSKFIENIKPEVFKQIESFFVEKFPKMAAKLYGKAAMAASTGVVGWMAMAYKIFDAASWVADSLSSALASFKTRMDREKRAQGQSGVVLEEN